ncbi:MAG: rhodanese-like domain-containing protein [Bacteroidota bacterium]
METILSTKKIESAHVKAIDVYELKRMMDKNQTFQLIDCREPDEYEFCNIGGELIPMSEVVDNVEKIRKNVPAIIMCRSGRRSADIIVELQQQFGLTNLYNLDGGILAWSREIDPNVPQY